MSNTGGGRTTAKATNERTRSERQGRDATACRRCTVMPLFGSLTLARVVARSRDEPIRIDRRPRQPIDGVLVRVHVRQAVRIPAVVHSARAGSRVPHLDQLVLAPREDDALGRVPPRGLDVPPVALQADDLVRGLEVPDRRRLVVAARHEVDVIGCERDVAHRLLVRAERLDVVHRRLPVLDDAALVRRQHQQVVVRPRHDSHRVLVRVGDDALEVELESVPLSELARVAAGDEATAVGRPRHRRDRRARLVHRERDPLRTDAHRRVVVDVVDQRREEARAVGRRLQHGSISVVARERALVLLVQQQVGVEVDALARHRRLLLAGLGEDRRLVATTTTGAHARAAPTATRTIATTAAAAGIVEVTRVVRHTTNERDRRGRTRGLACWWGRPLECGAHTAERARSKKQPRVKDEPVKKELHPASAPPSERQKSSAFGTG